MDESCSNAKGLSDNLGRSLVEHLSEDVTSGSEAQGNCHSPSHKPSAGSVAACSSTGLSLPPDPPSPPKCCERTSTSHASNLIDGHTRKVTNAGRSGVVKDALTGAAEQRALFKVVPSGRAPGTDSPECTLSRVKGLEFSLVRENCTVLNAAYSFARAVLRRVRPARLGVYRWPIPEGQSPYIGKIDAPQIESAEIEVYLTTTFEWTYSIVDSVCRVPGNSGFMVWERVYYYCGVASVVSPERVLSEDATWRAQENGMTWEEVRRDWEALHDGIKMGYFDAGLVLLDRLATG